MTFEETLIMKTEEAEEIVEKYLPEETGFQKTIFEASNYSVRAGGKRLRPIIMMETYRLFDGKGKVIEPFMAAIEYLHTSSLVHDDLPCLDNDEYRRGRKTTWVEYGDDMALLAGDALWNYAFETASSAFDLPENPRNVGKAIQVLSKKAGMDGMIGGQTVDVQMTGKPLTDDLLMFIYELKTSALLEASMMIGAILADASREDIRTVERIAKLVGLAFQIQDDILDVTSTTEELGKPVGSDEKNEKTTYVTIHGLDSARERVQELTEEAVSLMHSLAGENKFLETLLMSLCTREK